jgi:hypothetical protein
MLARNAKEVRLEACGMQEAGVAAVAQALKDGLLPHVSILKMDGDSSEVGSAILQELQEVWQVLALFLCVALMGGPLTLDWFGLLNGRAWLFQSAGKKASGLRLNFTSAAEERNTERKGAPQDY